MRRGIVGLVLCMIESQGGVKVTVFPGSEQTDLRDSTVNT